MSSELIYRNKTYNWRDEGDPIFKMMQDHLYSVVAKLLESKEGEKVLDIGCGTGGLIPYIKGIYLGIDVSKPNIEHCKKKYPNISFKNMTASNIDYDDYTFDKVVCSEVIEHMSIREIYGTLAEIKRVCKEGGKIVITVPNLYYLWGILPWSFIPIKRRMTLSMFRKGLKNGWVHENYKMPHKRFKPSYFKDLLEHYFVIKVYKTSFWYNNRIIHNKFPNVQKLIHRASWLGNHNIGNNIIAVLKNNKNLEV